MLDMNLSSEYTEDIRSLPGRSAHKRGELFMQKLSGRKLLLIGFTLFSMFFGAGNLIFPQDLGANVFQILGRVLIPLSKPGIATGITMVFVPAVSTFIISRMLGGGANLLIGDLIELQFLGNSYNLNLGSAMSLVLMVIVLLCMSFTSSFDEEEMEGVM